MSRYSARIRAARAFAGLTQADLAARLGVNEQTIKRRESPAGKEPKRGELMAIAAICGVPVEYLEGTVELPEDDAVSQLQREITDLRAAVVSLTADVLRHTAEIQELRGMGRRPGRSQGDAQ